MNNDFKNQIENKSNNELIEVYLNSNHYQKEFVELAMLELEKRDVDLSAYKLKKQHREDYLLERLEEGEPGNPIYISIGFISAIAGGILGIVAGYIYSQSKNKEFEDAYYVYDQKTRNLGIGMMALGIAVMVIVLLYRFT